MSKLFKRSDTRGILEARKEWLENKKNTTALRNYVSLLSEVTLSNVELNYALLSEVSIRELEADNCFFDDYFKIKRDVYTSICKFICNNSAYEFHNGYKSNDKSNYNKKIAILVKWAGKQYSPFAVAMDYYKCYVEMGYEVKVYVEGSTKMDIEPKLPSIMTEVNDGDNRFSGVLRYDSYSSIYKRIESIVEDIIEFDPLFLIDMSDEASVISLVLNNSIKTLNFPMRSGMGSCMDYSLYLCADIKRTVSVNKIYDCINEKKIVGFMPGVTNFSDIHKKLGYTREKYGISRNSFVVITVGTRLSNEISEKLVSSMFGLMYKHDIVWMIVGNSKDNKTINNTGKDMIENKKLILIDYEDSLECLYSICDVFLNPVRTGGGISILKAMHEELPIVISDIPSDGRVFVGEDNCINGDEASLVNYIETLFLNREYCKSVGALMKKRSEFFAIEKAAKRIIEIAERPVV